MYNRIGKLPLRVVLTAPFVILILVTGTLIGYLTFQNSQSAVNALAGQLHTEVTARIQERLDGYLATPQLINQLNLDGVHLEQVKLQDLDSLGRHFMTQIQRFDSVVSIAYANQQAEYAGATQKINGLTLSFSGQSTNNVLTTYRSNAQGKQLELINPAIPNYDPRPRPWYRAAVQAGGPIWTPIYLWSSGYVGLDAVAPVYNKEGKLTGVLDTSLILTGIGDFLQSLRVAQHGQTFIIERSGLLVAASAIKQPYTRRGDALKRLAALDSTELVVRSASQQLAEQFGAVANITTSRRFYFDLAGERYFAQVTPYGDTYGLDWLIVVVVPESDFMAQIYTNNRNTALLVVASLLVSIGIATLIARRVTQPISRLNQSARTLAHGDWAQKVVIDRSDEIGELARAFNQMAEQLQASFASLQASEVRFRAIFEQAAIGIALVDMQGNPIDANPALAAMLGYSPEELCALSFTQFTHPDDVDADLALFAELIAGARESYWLEKRYIRSGGQVVWGNLRFSLIRNTAGAPQFAIGMVEDITEARHIKQQYLQSQKLDSIGRLAGGIAHDFNNLLTVILGNTDMLLEQCGGDHPFHHDIAQIRDAAARAAALTRQLLAFSRKQVLIPSVVDLNAVVAGIAPLLKRLIGEQITLSINLAQDLGRVLADPGQLEQVIVNLVINARDAMPEGGTLILETANVMLDAPAPGAYVLLAVSDTGIGMDAATRERIFEPFFTTKELGKGTGLGLATVYGIITQSGGHIWLDSEVGQGATFKAYLPRCDAPDQAIEERTGEVGAAVTPFEATILLVEDDAGVRDLTDRLLRGWGHRVLVASDAQDALRVAAESPDPIDLLLTDVIMPGGTNGVALAAQLVVAYPSLRVCYMSGYTDTALTSQAVLPPGQTLIMKPFTVEALARAVRVALTPVDMQPPALQVRVTGM
jgi:two-component system cell cycle sensor histidine kinase/response regulator CckA